MSHNGYIKLDTLLQKIKVMQQNIYYIRFTQLTRLLSLRAHYSPAKLEDAGSTFLTLAEISAKIVSFGCLKKNPEPRRLGAIMTKLGFEKERSGHGGRRGYYVFEHTQSEIERMRHPEIF